MAKPDFTLKFISRSEDMRQLSETLTTLLVFVFDITERVGLAGWISDQRLGIHIEPDEETVKPAINELCENELIEITKTRRSVATVKGAQIRRELKS